MWRGFAKEYFEGGLVVLPGNGHSCILYKNKINAGRKNSRNRVGPKITVYPFICKCWIFAELSIHLQLSLEA